MHPSEKDLKCHKSKACGQFKVLYQLWKYQFALLKCFNNELGYSEKMLQYSAASHASSFEVGKSFDTAKLPTTFSFRLAKYQGH